MSRGAAPLQFTLKIASRCNLNCSYCYVYNQADDSWRNKPAIISNEVVAATAGRILTHCRLSGQDVVRIVFHGGEPCLAGKAAFDRWCEMLRTTLEPTTRVIFTVQTNGVLVDDEWAELFAQHRVGVGISVDGPPRTHDRHRVDHKGRGSYARVRRGIEAIRAARMPVHLLSVLDLGADPIETHEHLLSLGPESIDYIFPDHTHATIGHTRALHGATPCADFLIPIFDWWLDNPGRVTIAPLKAMAEAVLGGTPAVDFIGNRPYGFLFVETNGAIEGLDVLRVCEPNATDTLLNVLADDFADLAVSDSFHARAIFDGLPLPTACRGCDEAPTCGGGYLPHRFRPQGGFDNASAWCADLKKLFGHIRMRFGVAPEETALRRLALRPDLWEQVPVP